MPTYNIVWLENKSLSSGSIDADSPAAALDAFKAANNPGGSYPVTRTVKTEGRVSKVVKADGRCMAVVTEI